MTPGTIKNKRLATLCILGWVLFNYPFLSLFNRDFLIFGIPLLYVFLFLSWGILIVLIIWVTVSCPNAPIPGSGGKKLFSGKKIFGSDRTRGNG